MPYKQVFLALIQGSLLSFPPLAAARTKIGDEYLTEGRRAEQAQRYETALQLYDYAIEEDPHNLAYLEADRRARGLAAEERRNEGGKLAKSQDLRAAEAEYQAALRIDPQSQETKEEIRKLQQQIRALPEPLTLEPPNDPIYRIVILSTSPRQAYENIAKSAGIAVNFDRDVTDEPAAQDKVAQVSGVSVEDALNLAASVTQTSWKAVTRTAIHVARASAQNPSPAPPFGVRSSNQPHLAAKKPSSFMLLALPPGEALPAAAQADQLADVVHLVLQGAPVDAPNALGMTALRLSAIGDDPEIVRFLLDHGADPNLSGQAILSAAVSHGTEKIVRLLLEGHANPNVLDEHSEAPLDRAIFGGNEDIARLLLTNGANVNEGHWPNSRTLLHEVCAKGPAGMIPLLVEFGGDPALGDQFGETPLDLALASKNDDVVAVLLELARQYKPLRHAAARAMEDAVVRGHNSIARMLLDKGFDVNGLTEQGSTYLGDAALKRQQSMVNLLLDKGANVDLRSRSGGTALHDAALGGDPAIIDLLLSRGADINARNFESGATPLMLAASLNQQQAVAELLKHGASMQLRDRSGHTALDRAHENGSEEIIALLSKSRL